MNKLAFVLTASLVLCACSDPAPTPTPDPPEPKTVASSTASGGGHTELRDAIQAPLEKAQSVEVTLQESAAERDEALDQTGD